MKRLEPVISVEAVSDFIDLRTFIAGDSPERADRFIDEIRSRCETLADTPMIGRDRSELVPARVASRWEGT